MKPNVFTQHKLTKEDAEFILQCMRENIRRYGFATVDNLYMLANEPIRRSFFYVNVGWRSLDGAKIRWSIRGYKIIFPPLLVLVNEPNERFRYM